MAKIINVSRRDIELGTVKHYSSRTTVLIQITDPDLAPPVPVQDFGETYQFKFLDIDDATSPFAITTDIARDIAAILKSAYARQLNVVVHCTVGVCRSGAVVEAGVALGFDDPGIFRAPNVLVKKLVMKELGFATYE